jgi:hypothetical protein
MPESSSTESSTEGVASTGQAVSQQPIVYFQYNLTSDLVYERWVESEQRKLFNSSGRSPQEKFELLASKRISWEALDQGLAVRLCQQLYTEYEETYRALEGEREEKKALQEEMQRSESAQAAVTRLWEAYQECVENTSSQLSDASRLGNTLQHAISRIHVQLGEIGRVLRDVGSGEAIRVPADDCDMAEVPAGSPTQANGGSLGVLSHDNTERYPVDVICEMVVHGVAVGKGTLYLLLLDNPLQALIDKQGVPCETGLYLLHKNLTKCLQSLLPSSVALKDVSQWLDTRDTFTLESRRLDRILFAGLQEDDTSVAEQCMRVARYRANNGVAFISMDALGRVVDGLKVKVGGSKARGRQQYVDALDDFYEHVKREEMCLHDHLKHIQQEESMNELE